MAVKSKMDDRTIDSSQFKLEHMEQVFREKEKEAEQNGLLESETVKCTVTAPALKAAMMAEAMNGDDSGLAISNKKLATKAEKQFQSEHSAMGAYASLLQFYQHTTSRGLVLTLYASSNLWL